MKKKTESRGGNIDLNRLGKKVTGKEEERTSWRGRGEKANRKGKVRGEGGE